MAPQTNGQITSKHATLEISGDQVAAYGDVTNWVDISGSVNSVEPSGGAHMTGSTNTLGPFHDPLIGIGKKEAVEATIKAVYTEEAGEAVDLITGYALNQQQVWLRHRPKGSASGAWEFVGRGYFTEEPKVATDASSGDIILVEVPWFGKNWTQRVQGTS